MRAGRTWVEATYRVVPETVRPRLKSLVGFLLFRSGLYRRLWRHKALIVLFHRVDDALAGDPLTCSEREFTSYCDFLSRYFHVIPLSTLLDRLEAGDDISRCVAITFDDGYEDNRTVAARVLRSRDLHATFFLTTDFIGSEIVPWWDAELSITPRWMTWDDVGWLARNGFELGAHTLSHPDLGQMAGEAARTEILESGARLEDRVGAPVTLFSYPYGGPHQLLEENREQVRAAGYRCCLSAHGGVIGAGSDPFRLHRYPVAPPFDSVYHLAFDVLQQLRHPTPERTPEREADEEDRGWRGVDDELALGRASVDN